jgi:coenzyme Q-binding protein COQ10
MPKFETTRRVRHTPDQMFDLVADIEKYPEFVPMCERLMVRGRQSHSDGRETLVSAMTVGYGSINETFTSRVTLDRAASTITVEYLQGPFRHLVNRWRFVAVDGRPGEADVHFFIDYEFRNRLLGAMMGAVFDKAFRRLSAAFETRADAVYGRA